MTDTLSITKAREELTTLVENAKNKLSQYIITVNGSPAAVLISAKEYESWIETNEIMENPQLMNAIRQGQKDIESHKLYDWENVKQELKLHVVPNKTYRAGKKRT